MKKIILLSLTALFLTSCQRGCTRLERGLQITERNYTVTVFSGGDTVFVDTFKGIINNSENSDGIYYYNSNGDLVEISGDYIIKSN